VLDVQIAFTLSSGTSKSSWIDIHMYFADKDRAKVHSLRSPVNIYGDSIFDF